MIPDILRRDGPPTRTQCLLIEALDFQYPIIRDVDKVAFHELLDRYCYGNLTLKIENHWMYGPGHRMSKAREIVRPFGYIREQYMVNPVCHKVAVSLKLKFGIGCALGQ